MLYEWDSAKSRANLAKHGVDFADAVAVCASGHEAGAQGV
jgi:uncharacterized DUF497 family protein